MGAIQNYLQKNRKMGSGVSDKTFSYIDIWTAWYQGSVKSAHEYWVYDGINSKKCKRYKLGMAKKVCEDWANLLLNEKMAIKAGGFDNELADILKANNFSVRANQLIELTFALGTGALVEYLDSDEKPIIDYIRGDMIYPISWENGEITECAFGSLRTVDEKERIYLMICRKGIEADSEDPEKYYIENKYLNSETCGEVELPENIEEIVATGNERPNFQIITPNIYNNVDMDSPMGISVFANAIDQIKGADLVYDSYVNEFVLGRKRILVPYSAAKVQMQKDGKIDPKFDPNDNVYFALPGDRTEDMKLTEVDMTIRAQEHESAINKHLDLISLKCGMGTGRYKFDASGVKTATEVISDKSDLYQNLQKNKLMVQSALISMTEYLYFLKGKEEKIEVSINFDDSIIEDTNTTIDRNIKLVGASLRSKLTAIMEINKCSEEEAKTELQKITEENQITGRDVDWESLRDDETADEADNKEEPEEKGDIDGPAEKPEGGGADR